MSRSLQKLAWAVAIIGFLVGLVGFYQRFSLGHAGANYGSYVPWGLWVAAYIYFMGLSAGAFLFSTLAYVFRVESLKPVGKLALLTAFVTLVAAMLFVWIDLGHPERVWRLLLRTNFNSVMGWMAWLYSTYILLLIVKLWFAMRSDMAICASDAGLKGTLCTFLTFGHQDISAETLRRDMNVLRVLGGIGIPLAIALSGGGGALFGVVGARPVWNSGLTPILFLAGGLVSGGALLTFIAAIWGPDQGSESHRKVVTLMGQIVLGLLLFDLLLEGTEYATSLYAAIPSHIESMRLVLFGQYWWAFWIVHLLIGSVIPVIMLVVARNNVVATAAAGALIAVTFITVRLNIVIPALVVEELEGLRNAFTGLGLTFDYSPSVMEWLFFVWPVSLAGLLFLIGYHLLPVVRQKGEGIPVG